MWNLEYELIAILLVAAIIGLLMGRFLCKSGESEEKIKKSRVITAYKALQVDFDKAEERLSEQVSLNHMHEDSIAQHEQTIANLSTRLDSSDKHGAQHLDDLKVLEKYKTRFEGLSKEFGIQNKQIESLKDEKSSNIETIHAFETNTKILEETLSSLDEKYEETAQVLEDVSLLSQDQKKSIDELSLREKELIEQLDNYKIDRHDRLEFLEKEYKEVAEKLNIVIDERDDLVARIRAISSVVGAIGVEDA